MYYISSYVIYSDVFISLCITRLVSYLIRRFRILIHSRFCCTVSLLVLLVRDRVIYTHTEWHALKNVFIKPGNHRVSASQSQSFSLPLLPTCRSERLAVTPTLAQASVMSHMRHMIAPPSPHRALQCGESGAQQQWAVIILVDGPEPPPSTVARGV